MERLQKILSQAGVASRRAAKQLMLEGRVTVNGATVLESGAKADVTHDDIRVDGRRIKLPEHHRYILLNKPRGYVTTRSDPQRRPTVIDLLRGVTEYVYPVGRLDFDTQGLLILTNDGDLAAMLTHPRHGVARVYEAWVLGVPDAHDLDRLARGVTIDGRRTQRADVRMIQGTRQHLFQPRARVDARARGLAARAPAEVSLHPSARVDARARGLAARAPAEVSLHPSARVDARARGLPARGGGAPRAVKNDDSQASRASALLEITIREGRNRQVRKMCEAIGHPVTQLTRVAIGPIRDRKLKPGQWRELTAQEVSALTSQRSG